MAALRIGVAVAATLLVAARPLAAPPPPVAAAAPVPATIKSGVERWRAGDYAAAVAIWQPFAAAGDADAMFNMGQAYKLGRGVAANAAVARDYYRKAAAKGHLPAQANLGIALFQAGEKPESVKWLRAAADRGEPRAQYVLGIAAFNGDGLPRSQALGYGYLLRAQASGLPQATTALGSIAPGLSPTDRTAGEAVAASLAAGTGVPTALAAATAPRLITTPAAIVPKPAAPAPRPAPPVQVAVAEPPRPAPPVATAPPPAAVKPAVVEASPPPAPPPPVTIATTEVPASKPVAPVAPPPAKPTPAKPVATAALKPFETIVPATPAKKPDGWRVQLGAFSQRKLAETAWAAAKAEAGGAKPIFAADGAVVKLQMGPYATREAARTACARLSDAGRACFITNG